MTKKDNFKHIYEQSKDKIYRLCLGFTGNTMDCDDLFQEVYIKVWNNLESFRNESNVNTWIYRIATNAAIAFVANETKHTKRNSDLDPNTKLSYPEKRFYSDEKIAKLYQAISTLKRKRQTFNWFGIGRKQLCRNFENNGLHNIKCGSAN